MGRIPGRERFLPYTKWMLLVLIIGVIVWATPHTMIADRAELEAMGGSHHPFLGVLGVMSAKNTAVNLMILTTFLSFLLYRRANKRPVVSWARTGTIVQGALFAIAAAIVLFYGVYGYFVTRDRAHRLQRLPGAGGAGHDRRRDGDRRGDAARVRESRGEIRWGQMPPRSQYALFVLAVTFTWLMGLMGFARSGIRQHWHVWEVMRDTSECAATPALGYAAQRHQRLRADLPGTDRVHLLARRAGREAGQLVPRSPAGRADMRGDERCGMNLQVVRRLGTVGLYTLLANAIPQVESEVPEELSFTGDVSPEQLIEAGRGAVQRSRRMHGLPRARHARAQPAHGPGRAGRDRRALRTARRGRGLQGVPAPVDGRPERVRGGGLPADHARHVADAVRSADLVDDRVPRRARAGRSRSPRRTSRRRPGRSPARRRATAAAGGGGPSATTDPAALIQELQCVALPQAGRGRAGGRAAVRRNRLAPVDADEIRARDPRPRGVDRRPGYEQFAGVMPPNFGSRLTASQLEAIVDFLAARQ